jgi:hypothetical protein
MAAALRLARDAIVELNLSHTSIEEGSNAMPDKETTFNDGDTPWCGAIQSRARLDRRAALRLGIYVLGAATTPAFSEKAKKLESMAEWMDAWMSARARQSPGERELRGGFFLGRFKDPTYYLTKPIAWSPNSDQASKYQRVDVPIGFVTDFASIPRIFYSALRPDGDYAYAAVVHDYLYWTQQRSRESSDEIFNLAMQDLKIDTKTRSTIYNAVRAFGGHAWTANAKLKSNGEKRVLAKFPDDPVVTWEDWKKTPGVF